MPLLSHKVPTKGFFRLMVLVLAIGVGGAGGAAYVFFSPSSITFKTIVTLLCRSHP